MAGLYDRYQLTNSSQIPIYEGSANKEMMYVAEQLQGRYDQARAYDDYLAEQQKYAKVHDKDRGLFEQMTGQYRERIAERAKSGNYEDMLRATAQDARSFGRDYAAFADNLQRRAAYRDEIEKSRKDLNLTGETVDKLLAASEYRTKGLQKDPKTGQIVGQFQGITPSKEIDFAAWTDEKLKGIIAKETGWDATSIEGVAGMSEDGEKYYVQRGGKTVTVDAKRIKAVLNQAMQLDPEFQASLRQKAMLDTVGLDRMTPELLPEKDRVAVEAEAARTGLSFGEAFQQIQASRIVNGIVGGSMNYGVLKREQHDTDVSTNIRGETEGTGRKQADKESNNFGIPITIPKYGNEFADPGALANGVTQINSNIKKIDSDYALWSKNVTKGADGRYTKVDEAGRTVDVTDDAIGFRMLKQQEVKQKENLRQLEAESQREAGYTVTPQLKAEAQKAYSEAFNSSSGAAGYSGGGLSREERVKQAQKAYDEVLENNPKYKEYARILAEKSKNISMSTIATRFNKKSDNEAIKALVNNLSTNDFESNMMSMEYVGSQKGGQQFTPDDYDAIKGNIDFGGQFIDDKGEQAYIFSAQDPKTKERVQFQVKGIVSSMPLPKLTGQDARQVQAQQFVRGATNNPANYSKLQINPSTTLEIRVPSGAGGTYSLIIGQGKQAIKKNFTNEGDLTKAVDNVIRISSQ